MKKKQSFMIASLGKNALRNRLNCIVALLTE